MKNLNTKKFWIVEFTDVQAPKVERSLLFKTREAALQATHNKTDTFLHHDTIAHYMGYDSPILHNVLAKHL